MNMSIQRWNPSEGQKLVDQWRQSGLDKKAFCDMHGITYGRFLYWNKLLQQNDSSSDNKSGFVALAIEPATSFESVSLRGSNGIILNVTNSPASLQFVKALLTC